MFFASFAFLRTVLRATAGSVVDCGVGSGSVGLRAGRAATPCARTLGVRKAAHAGYAVCHGATAGLRNVGTRDPWSSWSTREAAARREQGVTKCAIDLGTTAGKSLQDPGGWAKARSADSSAALRRTARAGCPCASSRISRAPRRRGAAVASAGGVGKAFVSEAPRRPLRRRLPWCHATRQACSKSVLRSSKVWCWRLNCWIVSG